MDQVHPETLATLDAFFRTVILRQLGIFLLISAFVATLAGALLSRTLSRPLNELAAAARDIGARNLSRRVAIEAVDHVEEISDVARAFNEMASQLEQAETLRQNMLSDVAHELRTPVTVIQGNLRAILDDVYALDKEEIARLYDQTLLLSHLINDLRELAQAEARQLPLQLETVDVATLIKETAATYRPLIAAQSITFRPELLGALGQVTLDPHRIKQCLHNLLENALRYTPPQGTITLQAERLDGELEIRVMDSGSGIKAEHLPYVFDRFYRTDRARSREDGGSGLGLAIAKAIVEQHNGRISVISEGMGQGSRFTLHLPVEKGA